MSLPGDDVVLPALDRMNRMLIDYDYVTIETFYTNDKGERVPHDTYLDINRSTVYNYGYNLSTNEYIIDTIHGVFYGTIKGGSIG